MNGCGVWMSIWEILDAHPQIGSELFLPMLRISHIMHNHCTFPINLSSPMHIFHTTAPSYRDLDRRNGEPWWLFEQSWQTSHSRAMLKPLRAFGEKTNDHHTTTFAFNSAWDRCKYRFHNSTAAWNAWTWPGIKEVWQCLTWATAYSVFLSVPSLHVLPSSGPHFYRLAIAQGMLQDMDIVTCGRRPWDILIISDILWQTFWTFLVLKHAKTRWVWKLDASICKTDQTDQKQITERQDWLLSHTGPCARKRFCSSKWWDMLWAERLPWLPLLVTVHCFADEQLWEAGYWMVCRNDRQMDADIIMVQMPCKWIATV